MVKQSKRSSTIKFVKEFIEGLTNENGYVLNPQSYLQGVYLNDVAVEVSDPGAGSNQEVLNIEFSAFCAYLIS